ncbi:MAG TPA: divalent metal cation transporter, partial [Candidatus Thermoplasmatota archaeon]|nr:divalent metal cation transporter [Candidatus Thermoplasmatota archaeon]
ALLWTALLTWPLMTAVQLMCSRVGMVTGRGLVGALRQRLPSQVILIGAVGLLAANTINIGADLSAMADAADLFTGLNSHLWVLLFGAGIAWATVRLRYAVLARALKWLTLALLAYVVCAIYVGPDWGEVARATFLPSRPRGSMWSTLVAILGTTISPYLFFWQASQEVEEERAQGRRTVQDRQGASTNEIRMRTVDVLAGTFASNLVMYFIILTTAITLHQHGIIGITTSREAMVALEPIAGRFASALYAFAIIGVGFLAVPTLSGSAAYALAELFHWRDGLDLRLQQAPAFYGVVLLASLGGVAMDFFNLDPIGALYWSAVINGVLAPFLLAGVLLVASDSHVMALQPSSLLARGVVLLTILCMTAAAVGMFVH